MKFSDTILAGDATDDSIGSAFGKSGFAWSKDLDFLFAEMEDRGYAATIYTSQAIVKIYESESGIDLASVSCDIIDMGSNRRLALAMCAAIVISAGIDYEIVD